jgi:RNA polymerase sigma factor (sigma-70 family)
VETTEHRPTSLIGADEAEFIKAARTDDTGRFALLTERFRRELLAHCYRMLASYEDAQDLTQEAFLRAWAKRESFQGRASLRTWLYRIATNACLDFLEKRRDRTPIPTDLQGAGGTGTEVLYLQPWPDSQPEDPQERAVAKETIELAFIVAVQHLPARQRAVLILRDVLGRPAQQAADTLELTLASANSALQRARVTMREHLPEGRLDWSARGRARAERGRAEAGGGIRPGQREPRHRRAEGAAPRGPALRDAAAAGGLGRSGRNRQGLGGRRLRPWRLRRLEVPNHDGQRPAGSGHVPATFWGFDV